MSRARNSKRCSSPSYRSAWRGFRAAAIGCIAKAGTSTRSISSPTMPRRSPSPAAISTPTSLPIRLEALATAVQPLFDPPRVPDSAIGARIATLLDEIRDQRLPVAAQTSAIARRRRRAGPDAGSGFPAAGDAAAEYWHALRRHRSRARRAGARACCTSRRRRSRPRRSPPNAGRRWPRSRSSHRRRPPTVAQQRRRAAQDRLSPQPRRSAGGRDRSLSRRRRATSLDTFDSIDELKELLVALPPHLVVIDAAFENALDEIGALVKRARAEVSERLWFVALADDSELPKRLRAVRAGCDAFIALPAKADDVIARIGELIETERSNPYRIMIVEDDRSQTLFAESILRKAGMETLAINEGLLGARRARSLPARADPDGSLHARRRRHGADRADPRARSVHLDADRVPLRRARRRQAFRSAERRRRRFPVQADPAQAPHFRGDEPRAARAPDVLAPVSLRRSPSPRRRADGTVARDALLQTARRMPRDGRCAHARRRPARVRARRSAPRLRARLGEARCERLFAEIGSFIAGHAGPRDLVARDGDAGFLLLNSDREGCAARQAMRRTSAIASRARRSPPPKAPRSLLLDAGVAPFQGSGGDALAMLEAAKSVDRQSARAPAGTACSSCTTRRRRTTPSSRG